jgi:hypothetical protein
MLLIMVSTRLEDAFLNHLHFDVSIVSPNHRKLF